MFDPVSIIISHELPVTLAGPAPIGPASCRFPVASFQRHNFDRRFLDCSSIRDSPYVYGLFRHSSSIDCLFDVSLPRSRLNNFRTFLHGTFQSDYHLHYLVISFFHFTRRSQAIYHFQSWDSLSSLHSWDLTSSCQDNLFCQSSPLLRRCKVKGLEL